MKNKTVGLFLVLAVLIAILSGCGASRSKADSAAVKPASAPAYQASESKSSSAGGQASGISDSDLTFTSGESGKPVINQILNERKIIRNANLSIEVEDFDKAYGKLEFLTAGIGFIQETKISKEKHYLSGKEVFRTKGTIVIRVDADKFGSILRDVKGLGLLLEENIKSDDVTDQFFDLESRLRLIKYEESRLEEYLKKISDPDTIFKTEARLTDIRHEIESLTGNLNKLSSLVQLSTITINMSEKIPGAEKATDGSYWQKLISGFTESLKGVVEFCGELFLVVIKAIPVLVFIAAAVFIGFLTYRKFLKRYLKFSRQKDKEIDI